MPFSAAVALQTRHDVSSRAIRFLDERRPPTPCRIVDLHVVAARYASLSRTWTEATVFHTVEACPEPAVVERLAELGASFLVTSRREIDICLLAGVPAGRISYGSTIKKAADIAYAYEHGLRRFAFDSESELRKLAAAAPGAAVTCRLLADGDGPRRHGLGCEPAMASDLLVLAAGLGMDPAGVSCHRGGQQREPAPWQRVFSVVAQVFGATLARGLRLRAVNVGGVSPAQHETRGPNLAAHAAAVSTGLRKALPDERPELACEPGRSLVADAGVVRSEVVLVSRKGYGDHHRWVYLDVGGSAGAARGTGGAIRPRIRTSQDGPQGPAILAGPTGDVIDGYEGYQLPMSLGPGDTVDLLSAGAFTAPELTYTAAALPTYCI